MADGKGRGKGMITGADPFLNGQPLPAHPVAPSELGGRPSSPIVGVPYPGIDPLKPVVNKRAPFKLGGGR